MKTGRKCSVCTHPQASDITRALTAGGSKQAVAGRFGVTPSAVQRHRTGCLRITSENKKSRRGEGRISVDDLVRFESGSNDIASPQDLLDRLRSLFRLGDLLEEAYQRRDVDACVKLAREYRAAAESYARVAGWMTDAAQSGVTIDARRQTIALMGKLTLDELRALARGEPMAAIAGVSAPLTRLDATEMQRGSATDQKTPGNEHEKA